MLAVGDFKARPDLSRAMTDRENPRNKEIRDKQYHSKSSRHKKRQKATKERKNTDDKYKEPEGEVTSTGAVMVPVSQHYWRAGPDSDVCDSDFDDSIISGRVTCNLCTVHVLHQLCKYFPREHEATA